jgi:hypothetical protein
VVRKGLTSPNCQRFAEKVRPEGGGGDYGPNSGGYDQLGYGTLMATLPQGTFLLPRPKGRVPPALDPRLPTLDASGRLWPADGTMSGWPRPADIRFPLPGSP